MEKSLTKTQSEKVLKHLKTYGSINSWDAIRLYGITRLSAIIYNLRHKKGFNIKTETIKIPDFNNIKQDFARYVLIITIK